MPHLRTALAAISKHLDSTDACLTTEELQRCVAAVGSSLKTCDATKWCERAQGILKIIVKEIVDSLVVVIAALGAEVESLIPKYTHILSDTIFNVAQCQKIFLEQADRIQLSLKASRLHACIMKATQDYKTVCGKTSKLEIEYVDIATTTSIYKSAKTCVSIIGHMRVIKEYTGAKQKTEAETLAKVPCGAPKPLVERQLARSLHLQKRQILQLSVRRRIDAGIIRSSGWRSFPCRFPCQC